MSKTVTERVEEYFGLGPNITNIQEFVSKCEENPRYYLNYLRQRSLLPGFLKYVQAAPTEELNELFNRVSNLVITTYGRSEAIFEDISRKRFLGSIFSIIVQEILRRLGEEIRKLRNEICEIH